MASGPLVSVCIPVYNGEKYIGETIESVLKQTFKDFELVVCNNCSTDHTLDVVSKYQDPRIRVVTNEQNVGMVGNWNVCLKEARAPYVTVLCADDLITPTCLEKKYKMISKDERITLVFGASTVINTKGKVVVNRRPLRKTDVYNGAQIAKKSFRSHNIFGEPSNIMVRKDVALKLGGYTKDVLYSPDWEFCMRVASSGKVGYINEPLMQYRVSNDNLTTDFLKRNDLLEQDEKVLIREVKHISGLRLTQGDVVAHKVSIKARLIERYWFMKLLR